MTTWPASHRGLRALSGRETARVYESLGFQTVGTVPEAFEHPTQGYVGLCVMYRPL
jgi:hypothetical protein